METYCIFVFLITQFIKSNNINTNKFSLIEK